MLRHDRFVLEATSSMSNTNTQKMRPRYQDRRSEPRFPCSDSADVTVLNDATFTRHAAAILDVSRSGLQLELNAPLDPGARIKIQLSGAVIIGQVLHSRARSAECYRIGVLVSIVFRPDESDITPSLHALNQALTEHRQTDQNEQMPLRVNASSHDIIVPA